MKPSNSMRAVAALTLVGFVTTSCGSKAPSSPTLGSAAPLTDNVLVQLADAPPGLDLRLSNGAQGQPALDHATLAPATKIAEADAAKILARTKALVSDPSDKQDFALRERSQPPPRTGETIKGQFPPPPSSLLPPTSNDAGKALEVLRYMPEGAVPLAPELSVTFSQPMVPVTSQGDAAKVQPVKLTPQPPGAWRWIGTRTILFDPAVRFPQATTYKVEIPAGTKSEVGGVLGKAVSFGFETPTITVQQRYPYSGSPQHLDEPMFLLFDQQIDAAAILPFIAVTAGSKTFAVHQLDAAAIDKSPAIKNLVAQAKAEEHDGRWIAFAANDTFPADTGIAVTLQAGAPSAEGPNKTKSPWSFSFSTYPPLRITESQCGYHYKCPPGTPFGIEFNNPLDMKKFAASQLTVTPEIPGMKVINGGSSIGIIGMTTANTTYQVVVSGRVLDAFGQTLGKDAPLTFKVTDALPSFFGPEGLIVLDPVAKKPTLDVFSTNYEGYEVKLYAVTPGDWDAFAFYMQNRWNRDKPPTIPGKKVFDDRVKATAGKNKLVETAIDLAPALSKGGFGHVIAVVEPYPWTETYDPPRLHVWAQATKLGIDAHVDSDDLVGFATELTTGKAAGGVAIEMRPSGVKGSTGADGVVTLALPEGGSGSAMLLARRGDDVAFVNENGGYWSNYNSWTKQSRGKSLAWYVIDDRKMYRPAEEVHLKGWLRTIDSARRGDVGAADPSATEVTFVVNDSTGTKIAEGKAPVSLVGGFDAAFTLPKTPNLGTAQILLATSGGNYYHQFEIEEFRRPEFEVTTAASQGPFLVGGSADVTVTGKYYAGGPLPGAPVQWNLTQSETSYTPPNRDAYTFGTWTPWWGWGRRGMAVEDDQGDDGYGGPRVQGSRTFQHAAVTDASGSHTLHLDILSANPAVPMAVAAQASVTDVNRQTWTSTTNLIIHPSSLYVGLKTDRTFVEKGTSFGMDVVGVDLDGAFVPGSKIEVKTVRLDWAYENGDYKQIEVDPQTCAVTTEAKPSRCEFATKTGGSYQTTATIVDAKGRPNQTTLTFWVSGGEDPPSRDVTEQEVRIIPDRKEYADGQTAELMLLAPFYPAEAIVSWRRSGMVKNERLTFDGPSKTIHVPISDAMVPNLYVQVSLVGSAPRSDDKGQPDPSLPRRPAFATGEINLPIPPKQRTLSVTVTPSAAKVGPGDGATMAIVVKDAAGKPVADAETAVIVVDEAVLALTGYDIPSPIDSFYGQRDAGTRDHYSQAYVKLTRPDAGQLQANLGGPGMGNAAMESGMVGGAAPPPSPSAMAPPSEMAMDDAGPPTKSAAPRDQRMKTESTTTAATANAPIALRTNFNPLAAFSPAVKTDASGRATVTVKMPDNLTRYRIIAVAAAGARNFGKGESAITARLPLMVRPSPPRFLNFGDTFRLPVVVQNQTDAPMTVRVAVRATNAAFTDGTGREVTVPANDRVEVQFPAAAEMAGTARFQIVGAQTTGGGSDAAELALPVWTPATTEAFATYGVIDSGAIKQPIALPDKVVTQFGGVDVTTSSTQLQALTDAMLYLVTYPFECAEQRASRIIAIASLRDVLEAFKTKDMPSRDTMEKIVAADLEHLTQMQNGDGGFAFWERGYESWPFLTVHVTNALFRAQDKGYAVPPAMIQNALGYLKDIESHCPSYYGPEIRHSISAYALYVRKLHGDVDVAKAERLITEAGGVDKLSMEANGWLLGVFAGQANAKADVDKIVRFAMNHVSETAGAANFTTGYSDGGYLLLASDRRVDGVMLESLIQAQKDSDLIPKLVTGLLAHRKRGRWENTNENAFVLLALDRYFRVYENITPDFVARVWLGDGYAGEHAFKGRQTDYFNIAIPMKTVADQVQNVGGGTADLTIQKDGKGRLYYRIGMTYAPASLKLDAADYGFVVERTYEGVDEPKDVVRQADGTWKIKAGARVRIKLSMVNENRRYHVALVDPLPAGLEIMNPALAVTGAIPQDPKAQAERGAYWWWYGPWYEHQNMRDERAEAFASMLWEGVHSYTYVARATTPGNFVVPPPKAEEMYMPETFGRGASDRVIVE